MDGSLQLSNSLADLAACIRAEHEQVADAMQVGLAHALRAGELLLTAKKQVEHGRWEAWINEQCGIHARTGQRYMQIAVEFPKLDPEKATRVSLLSFREALRVIATPARTITQTFVKIDAVEAAAAAEPKRFGKLLDDVHRTGKVDGPFKRLTVMRQAEAIRAEPPPLPGNGPYRCGVADVPWPYEIRSDDPSHRATHPYPQMSIAEIMALPVPDIMHDDSSFWMWTTNHHMREAFGIVEHWRFEPKTILTWGKRNRFGYGDWLRGQTEHCILAVRGSPTITLTNQSTLLLADARANSEKPDVFYDLVESLCPAPRYAELFSRHWRERWDGHGDQAPKQAAE